MKPMTKTHILFVRACKSGNPQKRLKSLYRRLYYKGNPPDGKYTSILTEILIDIIDTYELISLKRYLQSFTKNIDMNLFFNKKVDEHTIKNEMLSVAINVIRQQDITTLEEKGFIKGAFWRVNKL